MDSDQIIEWCKHKGLSAPHAFVLSGVSLGVTDEEVCNVVNQVKALGQCILKGRCVDDTGKGQLLLIETSSDVTSIAMPPQLHAGEGMGVWVVHVADIKGKIMGDLPEASGQTPVAPAPIDLNRELVNAITSLVDKCRSAPDASNYRKLGLFSGMKPAPHGEDDYEAWAEQTDHMLDEWQCSDVVKKQRIAESLHGPAADIVRALRVTNPKATAADYMIALENAFGSTESAADLMVRFRNTLQHDGEKLSSYVMRLDKLLHAVRRKGGIGVASLDRTRIDQVVRGALTQDHVALRLRVMHKLREPPSFLELLREVREEEEMILARQNMQALTFPAVGRQVECAASLVAAAQPAAAPPVGEYSREIEMLRRDFQDLKSDLSRILSATLAAPIGSSKTSDPPRQGAAVSQKELKAGGGYSAAPRVGIFCYRCGDDGHFLRECPNPEDLRKVNMRLLKERRPTGNVPGAQ